MPLLLTSLRTLLSWPLRGKSKVGLRDKGHKNPVKKLFTFFRLVVSFPKEDVVETGPVRRVKSDQVRAARAQLTRRRQLPMVVDGLNTQVASHVSSVAANIPNMPLAYWINLAIIAHFTTRTGMTVGLIPVLLLALFCLDAVASHNIYPALRKRIIQRKAKLAAASKASRTPTDARTNNVLDRLGRLTPAA